MRHKREIKILGLKGINKTAINGHYNYVYRNSKEISGKLLDLKCGFTKLMGYKVNVKK